MARFIVLVWIGLIVCSCSDNTKKKYEQNDNAVIRENMARPEDVGEHKSIHQEEWEYHQNDTMNAN